MRIAIIPARGGSKRIPGKNIIPFCGKPMIYYPIEAAKASGIFHKIHVSTDSDEIRKKVEELGLTVDFMRTPELADDYTGLIPVLKWVVEKYQEQGEIYNEICCILPTTPFLHAEDLLSAYKLFKKHELKYPLLPVIRYPVPIEWAFLRDNNGFITAVSPSKLYHRSQDLPEAYYECGSFSLWSKNHLYFENPMSGKILSFVMTWEKVVDIDTPEDLVRAEHLFRIMRNA